MNCLRLMRPIYLQTFSKFNFAKHLSQHPLKFLESQEKWRQKDGVPSQWQLIYKAPMGEILNYATAYLTTSTTVVTACGLYYAAFVFDITKMDDPVLLGGEVVIANNTMECFIYVGAYFLFHIAVKILISKFVVRLYNNGDDYLAIFRGNWYNSIIKHEFNLQELEKLNPTFVVSWSDARFKLGKKHGIMIDKYFKTPEHFNYLINKKKI